jgi:hypothetical protein
MRSHLAPRFFMLVMVVLLAGALAVPAEGKRPRRYNSNVVLLDWTICPTGAPTTLTIGYTDPNIPPNPERTVNLDAELQSSPGSVIEGGPINNMPLEPASDEVPGGFLDIPDNPDEVVTDGDEVPIDPNITETITHKGVAELRWSRQVEIGQRVRVGLVDAEGESGSVLRYGLFETVFCPSNEDGGPGDSTPGVTTPGPSLSTKEIQEVTDRIDKTAQVGEGRGGSLVPRAQCTIIGTPGDDRISGTRGNDVICGLSGNDVIDGAGGIDVIDGANGNDRVTGGSGNDPLLLGLRGNDRLNGNGGDDTASGGAGTDRVRGSSGKDRLGGGSGDDLMNGGPGGDRIRGGSGDDDIRARDGIRDGVNGGSGLDRATVDLAGSAVGTQRRADRVRGVEQLP